VKPFKNVKFAKFTVPGFLLHKSHPVSIKIVEIVLFQAIDKHFVPAGCGLFQSVDEIQTFEGLTFREPILDRKIQVNLICTRSFEKHVFDVKLIQGRSLICCQSAHGADTTELGCGDKGVPI
jgi:hypothetical protein